jgi:hypothetical protein
MKFEPRITRMTRMTRIEEQGFWFLFPIRDIRVIRG